jgi:hypothetical protein
VAYPVICSCPSTTTAIPIFYSIRQLARSIMPMNLHTHAITILNIRNSRRPDQAPFNLFRGGVPCMTETGSKP